MKLYMYSSNPGAGKTGPAGINVKIQPREATVEYRGNVTDELMTELVNKIDDISRIYQPNKIVISINSPGGVITALHFFARNMVAWREKGLTIETFADTTCASAAAAMFTLGEVGCREAHPLSTLLFHRPRIMPSGTVLQEDDLVEYGQRLNKSQKEINHYLVSHLKSSLGVQGFAKTLKARASQLVEEGFAEKTEHLSLFANTLVFSLTEMTEEFEQWAQWDISHEQGAQELFDRWQTQIDALHIKDGRVDLRTAWGLLLIDKTDGLRDLCIRDFTQLDNRPIPTEQHPEEVQPISNISTKNRP